MLAKPTLPTIPGDDEVGRVWPGAGTGAPGVLVFDWKVPNYAPMVEVVAAPPAIID